MSDLFEKYKDKGLQVVGLTESIADIRSVYESLPAGKKTPSPGVDDMRPVLAGMLEHGWIEAELKPVIRKTGRSWKRMPSKAGRSSF